MIRKNFKSLAAIAMLTAVLCLILGKAASADDDAKPIRALLVIGGCCHDYAKQKEILTKGISAARMCNGRSLTTRIRVPNT